jgi:outer membrane protein assembly factor BamB
MHFLCLASQIPGLLALLAAILFVPAASGVEPWATYRGNLKRTGCTDGKAGPATPTVLWVHKTKEHYIASPVPWGDRLFVSSLGAFNVPNFTCLSVDPRAASRVVWNKSSPALKLPIVSSPGVAGGRLIFGDGMHQTDGAMLHCLDLETGKPVWDLSVPGKLVHLEGAPTIADGRVYVGGGAAGVLCVELDRILFEGKETDVATLRKIQQQRWKELEAKYQEELKKDKDFAVPPTEDQLPRGTPRLVWQKGQQRWHVDAPVAVAGDTVLVCTAFLEEEKVGERALYCLERKDGSVRWQVPLKVNPWGGASVAGNLVVVGGSTIGYDPRAAAGAKGELVAVNLATGKVQWRKDVQGGILSPIALAEGMAIATATDGAVRAFDLADGTPRWQYDARAPLFAPPAVSSGIVYIADLKGMVHAVELTSGKGRWKLNLATHPQVGAPGMVYGGPVLHGGRLFVATCNLEGLTAGQATAVVCIGEK